MAMTAQQWQPSDYAGDPAPTTNLRNPNVPQFNQTVKKQQVPYEKPIAGSREQAIKTYESMDTAPAPAWNPVSVGAPPPQTFQSGESSWANRLYSERAATNNRSGGSGSQQVQNPNRPVQAIPAPELPEFKSPDYKPPELDSNVYGDARREAMAPGMRELREGTREAISSSQSLDNPNARGKFIQQVLKGYGQGLESVAAGANREARGVENTEYNRMIDTYKIQHQAKSNAYLQNYQNEINTIATNFAQQQMVQESGGQATGPKTFGDNTSFFSKWRQ